MSFIDNFKNNFSKKLILSHLEQGSASELYLELQKLLSKDANNSYDFIYSIANEIVALLSKENRLPKNIYWINSFELAEIEFIENFLKFYFKKNKPDRGVYFNSLECELFDIMKSYKKNIDISFANYVVESQFYQLLITLLHNEHYIFLNNQMAFYEHSSGKMFTSNDFTQCYIGVVKNPYSIYEDLKKNNERFFAQNYIMNLDQQPIVKQIEEADIKFKFEINRQSWSTHASSWDNPNVMNTFRGIIIKVEDICQEPLDNLASIISHLIQAGINLKLDYDTIEEFITMTAMPNFNKNYQFSERKKNSLSGKLLLRLKNIIIY